MKNSGIRRLAYLFGAIAAMMKAPISDTGKLNAYRREAHYISGINPIYIPKRKKLKGWQKEAMRKKHYNKFH